MFLLLAFTGSICAGVILNVRGRKLLFAGFSGLVGWAVYFLMLNLTGQTILSIFAGALAVGIFSESIARVLKTPSTIFSIPGIFPIVPGVAAYEAVQLLTQNDTLNAAGKLIETLAGAGSIAFGILLVTAVFRLIFKPTMP